MNDEGSGTIVLKSMTAKGEEKYEFPADTMNIEISGQDLVSIDLTPLCRCSSLQILNLNFNKLQTINLAPLKSCFSLQTLVLRSNQIQFLDLSPLNSCINLQSLDLCGNQLQSINLTHLTSCVSLRILDISDNKIQSVDLSPLSSCVNLETLDISDNKIQSVDLSPLASCATLQNLNLRKNQLQSIDISPLSSCVNLQKLYLSNNLLQSIDLSPLTSCTTLKNFFLSSNQLQSIDISPLSSCVNLETFDLSWNQLQSIDLAPLSFCTNLYDLSLSRNELRSIDLTPLSTCIRLHNLSLLFNQLQSIDLTPFSHHPNIQGPELNKNPLRNIESFQGANYPVDSCLIELDDYDEIVQYDVPSPIHRLDLIAQLVPTVEGYAREWKLLHLLHQALRIRGLGNLGLLDIDPQQHLDRMLSEQVAVEALEETMVNLVAQQIDRGGPTIGLDIKGVSQHIELARRVETIIKTRKEELARVRITENAEGCDLRPLALTAYGFEVLTAMGMNLTTDKEGMSLIQEKIRELGCDLKTTVEKELPDPVEMSDEMKEYIGKLVEYNARKRAM